MRRANTQINKLPNNYTGYVQHLKNEGYSREQINIDERSEVITTRSLAKDTVGTVINIRCPCRYIISIAGREQFPEHTHTLTVRLANRDNVEIAPDTRIKIIKEKVSLAMLVIDYVFYKDISITEFMKDSQNETKKCDKLFRFNNSIELNGNEHLQIYAINPDIDIDANHINLSLDIDLWEQE